MVNKKRLILPIFIISIMVFSVFGVLLSSIGDNNANTIDYNGYAFVFDGNKWFTFKDKQKIEFLFDPRELDVIDLGGLLNKVFNHKKIYLSMLPKENLDKEREFLRQIISSLTKNPVINSCPLDEEGCENLPLKGCKDSIINEVLVIKLENGETNMIEKDSCITLIADNYNFIRIIEKIRLEALL